MKEKIDKRDKEIDRLSNLYMGGENKGVPNLMFTEKENQKTIQKLNEQLDYVNWENHNLLNKVGDLKIKTVNTKNFHVQNA